MSEKTRRTLNIKPSEGENEVIEAREGSTKELNRGSQDSQSLFTPLPQNGSQRKTETLSIRLTRELSDKLHLLRNRTGASTSYIAYDILEKSIDEVLRVNKLLP